MKCSEVRSFLSQVSDREEAVSPIPAADLDYLSGSGYVLRTTKADYDKGTAEVARLSQMFVQLKTEKDEEEQATASLLKDEHQEHSILFHLEGEPGQDALRERIQSETAMQAEEESELRTMEANVNQLIQEKSTIDRMVPYDGDYLSLTDLGTIILNDLNVRNYRVADSEFTDFVAEIQATYAELRSIAERATAYVGSLGPKIPGIDKAEMPEVEESEDDRPKAGAPSLLWAISIGLAKLQGDTNQIGGRFTQAFAALQSLSSTLPNKLMAAEIMTAMGGQDIPGLEATLAGLDRQLRGQSVPKELSAGVAATLMAGRRFDGTYPTGPFTEFHQISPSWEAASILAVMSLPYTPLSEKFQRFDSLFSSWGYMKSDDTEIASAFLAIGELDADEVGGKLEYIIEQLKNYLEYPLVAAAILASIPVFESHEALDLMEKAVTLLSGSAGGLERSELVALAVRMIHGVRNELVKQIDSTAKISETPVQFTYISHPGMLIWFNPVIVAHSTYHATFSAMGGFHPAHSHGVGGFAG